MIHSNGNNLQLSGFGKASGGKYNHVQLDGMTTVNGDIECNKFICSGKGKINGDIQAEHLSIQGLCNVEGDIKATKIEIDGKAKVEGDLTGEQITLNGIANIEGDCAAESFEADGAFTIDGLLNAEIINIHLRGKCTVEEIGGEQISVRKEKTDSHFNPLGSFFPAKFEAELIEGDKIYLEYTNAEIVRGNEITIGPGCDIETIEYKIGLYIDDSSKVESHRQI
jgi:cytoskeletal protein CcmA (bactofilin family)